MHIYTMGSRSYADAIVRIIDPTGRLFQDRVLTRDENESKRRLGGLFYLYSQGIPQGASKDLSLQ